MAELQLKPGTSWSETYARCVAAAPEAFESDRLLNLIDGRWQRVGRPGYHVTPVDGSPIQGPPQVDRATAMAAVEAAVRQHADWGKVELDERKERVTAAVDLMATHRDLLALLLVWEIGKPDYRRRQHGEAPSQPKSRLWVPETPRTYATC
jgi:delta 1-pyrroline-5-carboxylate dehydrogenase